MRADLHTHTTASDGHLAPQALVDAAVEAGVEMLAITDHDTMAAYDQLVAPPALAMVPGVELSSVWQGRGVHIVALDVSPSNPSMRAVLSHQRQARVDRARKIAHALRRLDAPDLFDAVCRRAGGAPPGRPHFAAELVARGLAKDMGAAFKRHLGTGKPGDVTTSWSSLGEVVQWILGAGGVPTLAHPARYGLTRAARERLVAAFVEAGGLAIEVVSGTQEASVTADLAALARRCRLLASVGSDFHFPGQAWGRLGACTLPANCEPVWTRLKARTSG